MKQLCEDDFRYLSSTQFADWKNFIITRYLRSELDIGNDKPLHRIAEAEETREEGVDSDLNDRVNSARSE